MAKQFIVIPFDEGDGYSYPRASFDSLNEAISYIKKQDYQYAIDTWSVYDTDTLKEVFTITEDELRLPDVGSVNP